MKDFQLSGCLLFNDFKYKFHGQDYTMNNSGTDNNSVFLRMTQMLLIIVNIYGLQNSLWIWQLIGERKMVGMENHMKNGNPKIDPDIIMAIVCIKTLMKVSG